MVKRKPPHRRFAIEHRIALGACGFALAGLIVGGLIGYLNIPDWRIIAALLLVLIIVLAFRAHRYSKKVLQPLRSLSNVLEAVKEEDYALRARRDRGGVLAELAYEINQLAESRTQQAQLVRESRALLEKLLQSMDLPLLAFDDQQQLVLANQAADRILGTRLRAGLQAASLGIEHLLQQRLENPVTLVLPGGSGRYVIKRRAFRMEGRPHQLLLLTEVEAALRAERQEAWESLVRVLAHEINNSLAPIKSIAETLLTISADGANMEAAELQSQLQRIAHRADALGRFVGGYATLARLPAPKTETLEVQSLLQGIAKLETRVPVKLEGEALHVRADPALLEQAIINLIKNAADIVCQDPHPEITVQWQRKASNEQLGVQINVIDNGPGPPESDNLFVPFFTTKPGGSGIGLLLARRIAELHGGSLSLKHREDGYIGAVAGLWVPMTRP